MNKFVKEEWDIYFSKGCIDKIDNVWKGIVYGNYVIVELKIVWNFFNFIFFDVNWIDGGVLRIWYLVYVGGKLIMVFFL